METSRGYFLTDGQVSIEHISQLLTKGRIMVHAHIYFQYINYLGRTSARLGKNGFTNNQHPLYAEISKAKPHASSRSHFRLLPSKNAAYRNSVLPALSQLLADRNAELKTFIQELA